MALKRVIIGILGPVLDRGAGPNRWERWRPSVAICNQEDLVVHRFEMLCQKPYEKLARLIQKDIGSVSPETDVRLHDVDWKDPWDFEEVYGALLDFSRRYPFKPDKEEYLVHITTGTHVAQICLFLLTEARYIPGKLIQCSPPSRDRDGSGEFRVIDLDLSRYDRIASRFRQEQRDDLSYLKSGIETRNHAFNSLIEQIERVAIQSRSPILLMGPTGAGKSQLARKIFELKQKRNQISGNFVELNCATLRGDSAMSILFGHIRGAFTGAVQPRKGLLRAATGGILFLDEIGELGPDEQGMLLRAIEEKRFLPLGSDVEVTSDFQLIAGTNRSLTGDVLTGRFREDLLSRINLWTFKLPGLRDRPEDIAPNVDFEIANFANKNGRMVRFSREALNLFLNFAVSGEARWSGNFRDLNAAITRMATLAPGGRMDLQTVNEEIGRLKESWATEPASREDSDLQALLGDRLQGIDLFERIQLAGVLKVCSECATVAAAGRKLFAVSRAETKSPNDSDRLRKYLAKYGIEWGTLKRVAGGP